MWNFCSQGETLSGFTNRQVTGIWNERLKNSGSWALSAWLVLQQMSSPALWTLLILLQSLVRDRRDLGAHLGQMNSKGAASSNKICISICDWRLEKVDTDSPFDVGLMMVATLICHCFPNRKCFSRRDHGSKICHFPEKISYLSWHYIYRCLFRESFDYLQCFTLYHLIRWIYQKPFVSKDNGLSLFFVVVHLEIFQ